MWYTASRVHLALTEHRRAILFSWWNVLWGPRHHGRSSLTASMRQCCHSAGRCCEVSGPSSAAWQLTVLTIHKSWVLISQHRDLGLTAYYLLNGLAWAHWKGEKEGPHWDLGYRRQYVLGWPSWSSKSSGNATDTAMKIPLGTHRLQLPWGHPHVYFTERTSKEKVHTYAPSLEMYAKPVRAQQTHKRTLRKWPHRKREPVPASLPGPSSMERRSKYHHYQTQPGDSWAGREVPEI